MNLKKRFLPLILFLFAELCCVGEIFTTSKCFDLLCAPQYIEKNKEEPRFSSLFSDTVFVTSFSEVNSNTRASKLCNLYVELNGDKDDIDKCLRLIQSLDSLAKNIEWASAILSVRPQLEYVLEHLIQNGYSEYWNEKVYPDLKVHIDNYNLDKDYLESINSSLSSFAIPDSLDDTHSNIYILDIDNAFNLSDESFCCTPLILDPEIEKQLRLSFVNIYIHENLHGLRISPELMAKLNGLDEDSFFKENEDIAKKHNEGGNEAFVVAAELFISNQLGIRDDQNVYDEVLQYVDGSLVLAPIIYVNLPYRNQNESYNDFLIRLFDNGIIKAGDIERSYNSAMNLLRSRIDK